MIFMARLAGRVQPEVGHFLFLQVCIADEIALVTFITLKGSMGFFQAVAGQPMIKGISIEVNDLEIPAMMIIMTDKAVLPSDLAGGVIPGIQVYPGFYFLMAIEAFFIAYFIPKFMAFSTVGSSFKVGMDFSKVAGGKL